jgi:PAS domain S-box-containing protein
MAQAQILVVEDENIIAMDIKSKLESLGYAVPAIIYVGEEAIEKTGEIHPDLVLMDIMLAGEMDGVQAAEQIKSQFDIPVVYLTAYAHEDILQRAKITESYGYILKPFETRELHANIEITLYKHRMEKKLKDSEVTYRLIVENIPDVVWSANQEGENTFVSPNIERVCGYTPEEICHGGTSFWLGIIHPDDVDQVREAYEALFQGNKMLNIEYRIQRQDGAWIWLHNRAVATYDKDGVIYADGVFSDITERKRAAAERARLISALQDALTQVKTLSGLLPICDCCKNIRDDQGYWNRIEAYIKKHSDAEFTHGICPECMQKLCPDKY